MRDVRDICPWGTPDDSGLIRGAIADEPTRDGSDLVLSGRVPGANQILETRNRDVYAPVAMDQERTNGCTSGSGGYVHAFTEAKARGNVPPPRSFLFGWYYARPPAFRGSNVGCQLRDFWTVCDQQGLPSDDGWPGSRDGAGLLDRSSLTPSAEAQEEAERWQTKGRYRIPDGDLVGITSALMAGWVVHTSRPVYESFYDVGSDGIVRAQLGRQIGYHAEAWWDIVFIAGRPYVLVCGTYGRGFGKDGWYYLDLFEIARYTLDTWVATAQELPAA